MKPFICFEYLWYSYFYKLFSQIFFVLIVLIIIIIACFIGRIKFISDYKFLKRARLKSFFYLLILENKITLILYNRVLFHLVDFENLINIKYYLIYNEILF